MSFQVQIPETGESFVAKAGETVLAAALRADVRLPHDCQAGGCGTCRVRLAAGSVSYDEAPFGLSPEEEAEDARLRVELWRACERLDAIIARRREREEQGLDVFFARPR